MPSFIAQLIQGAGQLTGPFLDRADFDHLNGLMRFGRGRPQLAAGYTFRRAQVAGVPVEWLEPAGPPASRTLIYLHGGGWVLGLNAGYPWLVSQMAAAAGQARAVLVDYRLAPRHPFPAGLDDCLAVIRGLWQTGLEPERTILLGDSAGGNLTLACLLELRAAGGPLPAAAASLCGALDLTPPNDQRAAMPADPLLPRLFAERMLKLYLGEHDARDPRFSPVLGDLSGLPPLLLQAGGREMLLSDSQRLAEKARAAGVPVRLSVYPGMAHVWHLYAPFMPEARQAVDEIGRFVKAQVK